MEYVGSCGLNKRKVCFSTLICDIKKVKVLFLLSYLKKIKVEKQTLDLEMLSMKGKRYKRQQIFSAASQKPNKKKNETMHYNDKEYIYLGIH